MDWDEFTIIGTSQELFKDYLRLTSVRVKYQIICCDNSTLWSQEPDPRDIRPYTVLEKALNELKIRWRQNNDYPWICNQFKSIRQDLTVRALTCSAYFLD